jgi:hypothetical protein
MVKWSESRFVFFLPGGFPMRRIFLVPISASIALLFFAPAILAEEPTKENGSPPALNLYGLDWCFFSEDDQAAVGHTWKVERPEAGAPKPETILHCTGEPRGYLYTKQEYDCFRLTLQWRRCTEDGTGRGGVLLYCARPHRIWPKSLEAQLNAEAAGDFWGLCDFPLLGPADRMEIVEHPDLGTLTHLEKTEDAEKEHGAWNTYEILADGETVVLTINGHEVNRCRLPERQGGYRGPICLTSEGDPIEFRRLKIVPLSESEEK